jgi:thiol-disulfide isomerase/thioredoxin
MENLNQQKTAKYRCAVVGIIIGAILICSPTFNRVLTAQVKRDVRPSFKLQNVAGGFMSSEDLKGKVAVVDVWATWCHPCVEEIPIFNQLYDAFEGQDVAIVGIAVESTRRDIGSRIRQLGIKYPVLIGTDEVYQAFPIQAFPTTVVIDKDGKIYRHYRGAVPNKKEKIKQDVETLLAADTTQAPNSATPAHRGL